MRYDKQAALDGLDSAADYDQLFEDLDTLFQEGPVTVNTIEDLLYDYPEVKAYWNKICRKGAADVDIDELCGELLDYIENELLDNTVSEADFYAGTNDSSNLY